MNRSSLASPEVGQLAFVKLLPSHAYPSGFTAGFQKVLITDVYHLTGLPLGDAVRSFHFCTLEELPEGKLRPFNILDFASHSWNNGYLVPSQSLKDKATFSRMKELMKDPELSYRLERTGGTEKAEILFEVFKKAESYVSLWYAFPKDWSKQTCVSPEAYRLVPQDMPF